MTGKKILFISTQLPYPPNSGGTVKSWNFVRHLAQNNSLRIACLLKDNDAEHEKEFCRILKLDDYQSEAIRVNRNAVNLLKSYVVAPSFNLYRNQSENFAKKVALMAGTCDLIIIDHYEMFQYLPEKSQAKVVLHTHNAEFMLWRRMAQISKNWIKKAILQLESWRVKRYENKIFKKSDLVFSTPSDQLLYQEEGINTSNHRTTFHLGNDHLLELADIQFKDTDLALTFIGTLSWEPNIDGLNWFIEKVWPKIKQAEPEVTLFVLGKDPDERLITTANKDPKIKFVGFVRDLDTYLKKTRVYLAPLRFGSGMKVKVLEGLYRGVPSVITPVAAEGLEVKEGIHAFISDQADAYAANCLKLLKDQTVWESMRSESRKLAAEKYRWEDLFQHMDLEMRQLLTAKN